MSADPFDDASDAELAYRERCIGNARRQGRVLPSNGHCYYCNAEVGNGVRWCGPDCREDWEMEQEANRRNNGRNNG